MSQLDLEAIRARNEEQKVRWVEAFRHVELDVPLPPSTEDIDALIAEVEQVKEIANRYLMQLGEHAAVIISQRETIDFLLDRWERWGPGKPDATRLDEKS